MVIKMKGFFFFLSFFAVQRCTTASVPESSSVSDQGGEGRGADGCPGQVRHGASAGRRSGPGRQSPGTGRRRVDDHRYKSDSFSMLRDWVEPSEPLDPLLASERLSSARNQHVDVTSHGRCCLQGQVQVTRGLSLMLR